MARTIPLDPYLAAEPINSRTLPTFYAVVLIALVVGWVTFHPSRHDALTVVGKPLALVGCMVAFAWLVPYVSLWLAVPVLLIPAFRVMGETRWLWIAGVAVAIAAAGWVITELLLGVQLPHGVWIE